MNVLKPQRPAKSFRVQEDENFPSTINQQVHQRNKSTGQLNMSSVGGLKAAAKRTVFGDVSNIAKTISSAHDDSAFTGKAYNTDVIKPLAVQDKSAAFLRPAQRPLNVAPKVTISNTTSHPESTVQSKAPLGEPRQPQVLSQPAIKRTQSTRATTIYKDTPENELQNLHPISTAPVHQSLSPRHVQSQPQLRQDPPILRRTQSKHMGTGSSENTIPSDSAYQEVANPLILDSSLATYEPYLRPADEKREEVQEAVKLVHDDLERHHRHLPIPPLVSEPEEYWPEEEEEVYDDQGYTTAHSYRSRGDNTTGGATTVLFPKATNKAKKELAAAKDLVENARTAEDIEDELWDTSMVAEYGDEIFAYMRELEVSLRAFIHLSNLLFVGQGCRVPERPAMQPSLRPLMRLCLHDIPALFT